MARYGVRIPITGYVFVEVEAEDEKAAEEAAWEKVNDGAFDEPDEWEFNRQVVQGNVCHAMLNEIEVNLIKD